MTVLKHLTYGLMLAAGIFLTAPASGQDEDVIKIEPLPQPKGALLEKDQYARERSWQERCLLKPAHDRWQDKAWAAEAEALIKEALRRGEDSAEDVSGLAARLRELLKQTGDEPLAAYASAVVLRAEHGNWRDAQPALDRVFKNTPLTPAALECLA
ncbi:MAG TPA: hypothetical protein VD994_16130, partial [Prosthecobacter sp.]|nr:hypothetical protein [Prosthecobacter sp.]